MTSEALRHANKLDAHEFDEPHGAAAELRRLAEVEDEWMALSQDQGKLEGQIDRLVAQRDALLEALKSTGLFLHHCWCDVQTNDYSVEKLNQQMAVVDAAIAKAEENT